MRTSRVDSTTEEETQLHWVTVGNGRLALTHRPKLRMLRTWHEVGCSRLVTLQTKREDATAVGVAAQATGIAWTWIPLSSGRPPVPGEDDDRQIAEAVLALAQHLEAGEAVALHCSAGIHRTGMVAYALLRRCGLEPDEALARVGEMRDVTRAGLTSAHLAYADTLADRLLQQDHGSRAAPE